MCDAFKRLDKTYFFSSYSQMISCKEMLSELSVHFPHRCLWLSQSIVRSTRYGGTTLQSQQQDNANHTIGMIKMRLSGQIITTRFNPPKACAVPMSVGGQLARLIEIATDDAKLSSMYIGWCTFT
ncbi:hypothetical protein niasHT_001058 [Heterodera trifolii]|uniref:FATC domain-containing protein n=1 Tax=Heterodera trifolii TaxID=157864 RepID=A0ABD2LQJ7_9BILA